MVLFSNVLGFSAFGVAVRMFQLGIQKKPVLGRLHTHALSAVAFGGLGYLVDGWEVRQAELIKEKHDLLRERRAAATAGSESS